MISFAFMYDIEFNVYASVKYKNVAYCFKKCVLFIKFQSNKIFPL